MYRCPKCLRTDSIQFAALVWVKVGEQHPDDEMVETEAIDSDHEWTEDSCARCTACGHTGRVITFDVDSANRHTIKLLVEVDAPVTDTPEAVAGMLDSVINAGLSDATESVELAEEDQMNNPGRVLQLNIRSPVVFPS